jgi:hypothetical protein
MFPMSEDGILIAFAFFCIALGGISLNLGARKFYWWSPLLGVMATWAMSLCLYQNADASKFFLFGGVICLIWTGGCYLMQIGKNPPLLDNQP